MMRGAVMHALCHVRVEEREAPRIRDRFVFANATLKKGR
jgi:hypothetical protein